ncbi:uncharacterized protein IUM83_10612 [Phytophthora cinnamomi]|uniref:uncharacterized protein n=1 Tax=Phytophthora cinnamomi TaxID=4785 RepID=UPI00355A4AE5|nr:hypothetical protein IUM83_10612 [Phytophthora cinnamomi]
MRSTAATPATTLSVIPDKDRKRPYRLSSKQRQRRLDNEALESRTFNLTLDHEAGEAVGMVARLFRLFCDETCGTNEEQPDDRHLFLFRVHDRLTNSSAGGRDDVPGFMQTWKNFKLLFTHRSYTVKSIRLVSHTDHTETDNHSAAICTSEAQQRCGPSGCCVIESTGEFTGRLKRDAITAILPRLFQDEVLVSHLIGQKFSCSLRMMAYFNAQGQLVDHAAEFDVIGALCVVIGDCSQN